MEWFWIVLIVLGTAAVFILGFFAAFIYIGHKVFGD